MTQPMGMHVLDARTFANTLEQAAQYMTIHRSWIIALCNKKQGDGWFCAGIVTILEIFPDCFGAPSAETDCAGLITFAVAHPDFVLGHIEIVEDQVAEFLGA